MRAFHFLSAEHALQALRKQRIKVAILTELNDPFELFSADLSDAKVRREFKKWKDRKSKEIGLLCFSRGRRNPLLWSHYANKHRGVALEFEIDDEVVVPVRYRKYRRRLSVSRVMLSGSFSADLAEQLASTKSEHWSYEEEVRVPIQLSNCMVEDGKHFEVLPAHMRIVGLVLGPLCTLGQRDVESALRCGERITLLRARLAFRSFDVVLDKSARTRIVDGAG